MKEKERYILYKHISPSNKVYIGITQQNPEKRWQNGRGYKSNKYFWRAIQKYGWDNFKHEILYVDLTKEEAEQKEIELIAYYDSTKKENGYNIDNGGNCIGSFSDEHRRNISKSLTGKVNLNLRGEKHPMYGKHHSEEIKKKISESRKGKGGFVLSEEHKKHLSKIHSKPVLQYDSDGTFIKEWESAVVASKETGILRSDITSCCNNKIKTCGGFIWKHKKDELKHEDIDKHKPFYYQCKPINQYSIDGKFIRKYKSIKEAVLENNFNNKSGLSNIHYCCSGKIKTAYGYIWKYDGEELILENHKSKINKSVIQYSKNNDLIKIYKSVKEASNENKINISSIIKCCKGQLKTAGGYIWRYANDVDCSNQI